MRGKVSFGVVEDILDRITPAYAGKRFLVKFIAGIIWDHPRLCGEKFCPCKFHGVRQGSPPPMRGKVGGEGEGKDRVRITPAYAGKSHLYGIITVEVRDHPRLCGEKVTGEINRCSTTGSPPPMRGKD